MSSVSLNGNKYLPENFKKVDLQGKDAETYIKENKPEIKTNFKDEIYVSHKGDLYVAEFNKFPQSDLKKENISFVDMPDAKIELIDDELEKHPVADVKIQGVLSDDGKKFIKENFKVSKSDKVTHEDLIEKINHLKEKSKDKFLSVDMSPAPMPGSKTGEVELIVSAVENPKNVSFEGVDAKDTEKLKTFFKGDLNKGNIQQGIDKIKAEYKSHPTKMLVPPLDWDIDNKGTIKFKINTVDLPSKVNINVEGLNKDGSIGIQTLSEEEQETINESFKAPLNPESVENGIKDLENFYSKQGMMLVNTKIGINSEGQLNLNLTKVDAPTQISVSGMEVFDADDIKKHFKMPLTQASIEKGTQDVKNMYKDAGYVLVGKNGGVDVDTDGDELRVKISLAHLEKIEVFDNGKIKDKTVTREMGNLTPGRPLNLNEVEKGIERVKKTGLFKDASYTLDVKENGKTKVNVVAQEQKNNEFAVFGGYSPQEGLFGGGSMTFGNLGGTGKSLAVQGEAGTKRLGGSITYTDPWLTDKKMGLSTSFYGYKWDGPQTTESRAGNTTSLNIPLGENFLDSKWNLSPSLRTEYIGVDKEFSSSGTGKDFLVMPKVGFNYNSVDNNINPKQGQKFGVSAGVGTGTATFGQVDANYKKYIPLTEDKKLVLSLGLSGGVQAGNVPYYEKYNSFNSTSVYGRSNDGKERDNYYGVASANLKYNIKGPVSLIAGTTLGGIGDNISNIGAGGGVEVNLMGIPISVTAGARYNPVSGKTSTAVNVNIFKLDF